MGLTGITEPYVEVPLKIPSIDDRRSNLDDQQRELIERVKRESYEKGRCEGYKLGQIDGAQKFLQALVDW